MSLRAVAGSSRLVGWPWAVLIGLSVVFVALVTVLSCIYSDLDIHRHSCTPRGTVSIGCMGDSFEFFPGISLFDHRFSLAYHCLTIFSPLYITV